MITVPASCQLIQTITTTKVEPTTAAEAAEALCFPPITCVGFIFRRKNSLYLKSCLQVCLIDIPIDIKGQISLLKQVSGIQTRCVMM